MRVWLLLSAAVLVALTATLLYMTSCTPRQPSGFEPHEPAAERSPVEDDDAPTEPALEPHEDDPAAPDAEAPDAEAPDTDTAAAPPAAILADMRDARDCYHDPECHRGDGNDPRGHYYQAGQAVAAGLHELRARHGAGEIVDAELARAAREFMAFDNPHARTEALAAFGEVPPDPRNLDAITDALDQHHAAQLFEPALEEFRRYDSDEAHRRIDAFLQSNLRTGAHRSAETIARGLTPFLRTDNLDEFAAIADELRSDSRRAQLIRDAIKAYHRRDPND